MNARKSLRVLVALFILIGSSLARGQDAPNAFEIQFRDKEGAPISPKNSVVTMSLSEEDLQLLIRISQWIREDHEEDVQRSVDGVRPDSPVANQIFGVGTYAKSDGSKASVFFSKTGALLTAGLHEINDQALQSRFRELLIRGLSTAALGTNRENPDVK
ncbi:hypothetical protein [Haloferula helveola]|uniref:hypothetical protein n=1 Tax=Haloferula helveola TaxID=490095 RepID=UPI0030D4DCC2